MLDDESQDDRPLYRYWWFWVMVALVLLALFKQISGIDLFAFLGKVDRSQPNAMKAMCQVVFPCNYVWDLTAPEDLRSTAPPPSRPHYQND